MTVSTIPPRPTPAGIEDGDHVILRQQQLAGSGEIVVAMLEAEATVKRLKIVRDLIELRPEDRHLASIIVNPEADLRIVGEMVAVRRPPNRYAGQEAESDG
jgi:repressor LexA